MSHSNQGYSRRKLLQFAGLAAGSTAFTIACNRIALTDGETIGETAASSQSIDPVSSSPAPTPTAPSGISRVVLVHSEDRIAGTRQALDLLQPAGIREQTIFLKPNYNTADPAPASTDSALLEALVQELQNAGAGLITIGD